MKIRSITPILYFSFLLLLIFSNHEIFAQNISNNHQKVKIKMPPSKVDQYFENFSTSTLRPLNLETTILDSIIRKDSSIILYLTEKKIYESAKVATDQAGYNRMVKNQAELPYNVLMLYKWKFNAEVAKSPIKPEINPSFIRTGPVKWNITVEPLGADSSVLTFTFNSLVPRNKKEFVSTFAGKVDGLFDYTIDKIFITEKFRKEILDYLNYMLKADANGVQPTRG